MCCSQLHRYGQARLRLPLARDFGDRGLSFMLLEASSSMTDEVLTRRALLMAAAYRLHCRHRRAATPFDDAIISRALDQAVKEASLGHRGAMKHLDSAWVQNQLSSSSSSHREAAS